MLQISVSLASLSDSCLGLVVLSTGSVARNKD